jgi:pyruvate/2-oxoglutarate dehydrogenase complex dihydrolipoamide dehydrogenase (E3) component
MKQYDAIIIGAGQAGGPLAKKLALAGKKTVLIEKRWIGGTCVNDGCTPTKTMIASAKVAYMAGHSAHMGVKIKGVSVDLPKIKKRKDGIVHLFRNGSLDGLKKTKNLDILFGEATFTGDKTIEVDINDGGKKVLTAGLIFINTGAKTVIPEIAGLNEVDYLTSTTILDLKKVPEHLLVIGGNYIGLEFGQMFRRFGSKVTILEKSGRIISREDEDISEALTQILKDEKITIHANASTTKIKQKDDGQITATVNVGGKPKL